MTIDKVVASPREAVADIRDGATIVTSGFGVNHGFAASLIVALRAQGARHLRIIANSLGTGPFRAQSLIENHQVDRLIVSFTGRAGAGLSAAEEQIRAGEITVELVAQGTLVERLRAGGAGIGAIYTRTGVGTEIAAGKEIRLFDGVPHVLETALRADYGFIRAFRADRFGNLQFRGAGRNFNPSFAKSAGIVIAEVNEIVEGELDPELVGLPGIFVDRVVRQTEVPPVVPPVPRTAEGAEVARTYNGKLAWSRAEVAEIAAGLLPEPSYVNLGLGMPTLMSDYISGRDIVLHSENGLLGYSDLATAENFDPELYNAGSQFVTLAPGASFFDSCTSFEMVRGGHLDVVVLGAFQVDSQANLANWTTPEIVGGAIGGAMDLVASGATVMVLMAHCERNGEAKLVRRCSLPLTGIGCVDLVVTDLCVLRRRDGRFVIERTAPGFTMSEVVALAEMELLPSDA
ncbi:MAG TPA: 3-oxoacid CoA-transferase subunit A [Acidimicrobiales bacterium]|nr:3-oxoacid CoA-transferase subunit A [Acidimicrobiales bacterium]